jgi:hypothetical protein
VGPRRCRRTPRESQWGAYRANLSDAQVSEATLSGADLSEPNLSGAELEDANFTGANLSRAMLFSVGVSRTNLCRANLSGVRFCGAYLGDVRNLGAANGEPLPIPVVGEIDASILAAIEADPAALDMRLRDDIHPDENVGKGLSRMGWAVALAGDAGQALAKMIGIDGAGELIYAVSRPGMRVPEFFSSAEDVLASIRADARNHRT